MGIGRKLGLGARRALRWIGGAAGFLKNPLVKPFAVGIAGQLLGEKAPRYLAALDKLERGMGRHTRFFDKLERAAKVPRSRTRGEPDRAAIRALEAVGYAVLDPDEARYGFGWKREWDRYVRAPLRKLAGRLKTAA